LEPTFTPTTTPTDGCTAKPGKPILKAPANNAALGTVRAKLKWNPASCAESYQVVVKDTATKKTVDKKAGLTVLKYKTKPLERGSEYKWFVKACNPFGCNRSSPRLFTIE
jgi:hypothetical protein